MLRSIISTAIAASFVLVAVSPASAALIDAFSVGQDLLADVNTSFDESVVTGPSTSILGEERYASVTHVTGDNVVELEANAGGTGLLNYSSGADTLGSAFVLWDGIGNAGLDFDLTEGGDYDKFRIQVAFKDLPIDLKLVVTSGSDAGPISEAILNLPAPIVTPEEFDILFTDFVAVSGGGADFTDVHSVALEINAQYAATDLQVDFIKTETPEPVSLSLLALGGLIALRRRR